LAAPDFFPPPPRGMKGRAAELATLARTVRETRPARMALVGSGGSGKSMLAAALGHAVAKDFGGRIHWFRVGAWDFQTLAEMLALRFGTPRARGELVPRLVRFLARDERFLVLDNHEDDRAMARLLEALAGTKASFVITARRCLLSGVLVFPVTAPRVTSGRAAFPRVAPLTRALRWNPLALDIADAIVGTRAATVPALARFLDEGGVSRVTAIAHEDDLPEVALLVAWAWPRLLPASRRILGVLSHLEGDHADLASLARLGDVRGEVAAREALTALARWHLVQEPMRGRYAVHAVVRHAVLKRTTFDPARAFEHYVALLEKDPTRLAWEQTHLFSAMDHAHKTGDMTGMLRVERLLSQLDPRA